MSLYTMYSKCPIIGTMCWAVLKRTRGKHAIFEDAEDAYKNVEVKRVIEQYKNNRDFFKDEKEIDHETRVFFHRHYGWEISYQEKFEEEIRKWANEETHQLPTHPKLAPYFRLGSVMLRHTRSDSVMHRTSQNCPLFEKYCEGYEAGRKWMHLGTGEMSTDVDKLMSKRKMRERGRQIPLRDLQTGPDMFVNT